MSDSDNTIESGGLSASDSETDNTPGPDEAYCADCGKIIKAKAEVCPECGVRQKPADETSPQQQSPQQGPANHRQRELEKIANKDKTVVLLMSFFLTPVGYWMVGKTGLALLNFFTFNYFLLGPIIVPIHCNKIIEDAKTELRQSGVAGY